MNNTRLLSNWLVGAMAALLLATGARAEADDVTAEGVLQSMSAWDRAHPYREVRQYIFSNGQARHLDSITILGDFGTEGYLRVLGEYAEYWLVNTPERSFAYFPLSGAVGGAPTASVRSVRAHAEGLATFATLAQETRVTLDDDVRVLTFRWNPAEAAQVGLCRPGSRDASRTFRVREDGFVTDVIDVDDGVMTRMTFELVTQGRAAVQKRLPRLPVTRATEPMPFDEAMKLELRIRQGMELH